MCLEDLPQPIKDAILEAANRDDYTPMANTFSLTSQILKKMFNFRGVH